MQIASSHFQSKSSRHISDLRIGFEGEDAVNPAAHEKCMPAHIGSDVERSKPHAPLAPLDGDRKKIEFT
jgi:hypothetical protein